MRIALKLFFIIWLVYFVFVVPGGGVNPNRYFDVIHSLVDQQTITIDAYHENTIDKAFRDGHYYSAGLIGPSLVGIPAYLIFKVFYSCFPPDLLNLISGIQSFEQGNAAGFYQTDTTAFFLSTIWITWFTLMPISAFGAVALYKLLKLLGIEERSSLATTFIYAFGTLIFFYSTTYFSHVFSASVICVVLYSLGIARINKSFAWWFGLGILTGALILIEFWSVLIIVLIGAYLLYRFGWRSLLKYALGVGIPLSIFMIYNTIAFGGPIHSPQEFIVGVNRDRVHAVGVLGFTLPTLDRVYGLLLSPERGIFLYSPILVLSLVGWWRTINTHGNLFHRDLAILSILASVGIIIMVASYADWKGGAAFGPRQIVLIIPFLCVGIGFSLTSISKWVWIPLLAISILINWLGAQFGFAVSVWVHFQTLGVQGPTLPVFGAILSHSTSKSILYNLAERYHVYLTIFSSILLLCIIAWVFREQWRTREQHSANQVSIVD